MGNSIYKRKSHVLTSEDIQRLFRKKHDDDSYMYDVEYEKLMRERERLAEQYQREMAEYDRLMEQIQREMEQSISAGNEDRYMAVLSQRGVLLQQQQKEVSDRLDKLADQRTDVDKQLAELRKNAFSGSTHASDYKPAEGKYKGFKSESQREAKVVEMSPAEYLRRVAFQFGNGDVKSLLRVASPREIEKVAGQMRRGVKFNSPSLNYKDGKASGNRQAIASLLNGYKRIPVLIIE